MGFASSALRISLTALTWSKSAGLKRTCSHRVKFSLILHTVSMHTNTHTCMHTHTHTHACTHACMHAHTHTHTHLYTHTHYSNHLHLKRNKKQLLTNGDLTCLSAPFVCGDLIASVLHYQNKNKQKRDTFKTVLTQKFVSKNVNAK